MSARPPFAGSPAGVYDTGGPRRFWHPVEGSQDPEGEFDHAEWFVDPEARTLSGNVKLTATSGLQTSFLVPAARASQTIHVILQVNDHGTPNLTSYRRAIVTINN